jgi:hypothetical protein
MVKLDQCVTAVSVICLGGGVEPNFSLLLLRLMVLVLLLLLLTDVCNDTDDLMHCDCMDARRELQALRVNALFLCIRNRGWLGAVMGCGAQQRRVCSRFARAVACISALPR